MVSGPGAKARFRRLHWLDQWLPASFNPGDTTVKGWLIRLAVNAVVLFVAVGGIVFGMGFWRDSESTWGGVPLFVWILCLLFFWLHCPPKIRHTLLRRPTTAPEGSRYWEDGVLMDAEPREEIKRGLELIGVGLCLAVVGWLVQGAPEFDAQLGPRRGRGAAMAILGLLMTAWGALGTLDGGLRLLGRRLR